MTQPDSKQQCVSLKLKAQDFYKQELRSENAASTSSPWVASLATDRED